MDVKEIQATFDEAAKGLKDRVEGAEAKAAEALNKYEEAKAELEKSAPKEMVEALETRVKALQDMADTMAIKLQNRGGNGGNTAKSAWDVLKDQFESKKNDLAKFIQEKNGHISLDLKDVVTDTQIFGDRVIFGLREPGIDKVPFRERFIFNLIQSIQGGVGSNPLSWVEQVPVSGVGLASSAEWTEENANKPVLKWEYKENKVTAEMIAATAYITRQAVLNWAILQSEIQNELMRELYDVLDDSIINGDGQGGVIFGIKSYAKAFNSGDIAAVTDPQNYDVLRAAIAQVRRGGAPTDRKRGGFIPNFILLPVDKAADMDLAKSSTDGHYLMPPFTSNDGTVIKGVRVIETNFLEGDEFLVGDFSRYLFNVVDGLRLDIGYINDQFVKNQFTIRAEMYGMGRVKANEAFAFVHGTFEDAKVQLAAGPTT